MPLNRGIFLCEATTKTKSILKEKEVKNWLLILAAIGISTTIAIAKDTVVILEFDHPMDKREWTAWYLDRGGEDMSGYYVRTWDFHSFRMSRDVNIKTYGGCMTEKWVGIPEVAEFLGVSKETVYRWLKRQQPGFPAYRIGRLWRFKISEVNIWAKEQH